MKRILMVIMLVACLFVLTGCIDEKKAEDSITIKPTFISPKYIDCDNYVMCYEYVYGLTSSSIQLSCVVITDYKARFEKYCN